MHIAVECVMMFIAQLFCHATRDSDIDPITSIATVTSKHS